MPDELGVFIFDFDLEGKVSQEAPEDYVDYKEKTFVQSEAAVSQWLNQKADDIASDIEREVRRVFRPFGFGSVNAQAEVSFTPGSSLVIAGTVMVAGALGTIASQAASQALGQNLARLLEIPINRVLRRWLNRGNEKEAAPGARLQLESFSVDIESNAPATPQQEQPTLVASGQEPSASGISWLSWTAAAVTVLAILNTILLVA